MGWGGGGVGGTLREASMPSKAGIRAAMNSLSIASSCTFCGSYLVMCSRILGCPWWLESGWTHWDNIHYCTYKRSWEDGEWVGSEIGYNNDLAIGLSLLFSPCWWRRSMSFINFFSHCSLIIFPIGFLMKVPSGLFYCAPITLILPKTIPLWLLSKKICWLPQAMETIPLWLLFKKCAGCPRPWICL